jgi:hypothetical protein
MKPDTRFYWALGAFFVLAIAAWLIGLGALGQWLWQLLHGMPPVSNAR